MTTQNKDTEEHLNDLSEAAEWHLRMSEPGFSQEDYASWLEWIESEPRKAEAFDDVESFSKTLGESISMLDEVPLPELSELEQDDYDPAISINEWRSRKQTLKPSKARYGWVAIAASLIASAGLVSYWVLDSRFTGNEVILQTYVTSSSEHQSVELYDGSKIEIGADSTVTIDYSDEQRMVILENGEAFFTVASDTSRPFRVIAGRGTITAIGTEFNVRRDSDRVLVTVTEGTVTVHRRNSAIPGSGSGGIVITDMQQSSMATLGIGQQVSYDSGGLTGVIAGDPAIATSWKDRRLQYLREPLRFVISGVNRYSDVDIVVVDSELGDMKFTGTVYDGQTDEWLEGLSKVLPVEVEYVGNSTVLLKQRK